MIGKVDLQVLDHEERRLGGRSAPARRRGGRRARCRRRAATLLGEVAGRLLAVADRAQRRLLRRRRARGRGRAGSAAGKGSRGGRSRRRRRLAGDGVEPRVGGVDARHALQQRDGVGVARPRERSRRPAPVSTMRPPYITATRWATSATTPRSWVMRITAAPVSAWRRASSGQHLRLDGDVEGRRRLVGDDELRAARPSPWRSPRAGACRRRTGAGTGRRGRPGRRCRPRAGARPRAPAPGRAARRPWATWPSMIWRPTGRTGFSVVVGSWKTKPTSSAAQAAQASRGRRRSPPARRGGSSRDTRAVSRQKPGDGERGDALARARLADDAEHLVRRKRRSSMPRTAGTGRPDPTKVTSSARTDRTGSAVRPIRCSTASGRPLRQGLNPIVRATSMLSMSSVKPVDVLRRDDQARSRRCWSGCRRPSRPAPC